MKSRLRPRQKLALRMIGEALDNGHRSVMMQGPTGFGKTVIGAAIADKCLRTNRRLLFCVPSIGLVDQTIQGFWDEGIRDVGAIQADHPLTNLSMPIQVASIQTLISRDIPPADMIIMDEAHRWFRAAEEWWRAPIWKDSPIIGLSATPWSKGLGKWYDKLVIPATTQQLIDEGSLVDFKVFGPSEPDLHGVPTVAGDWAENHLHQRMAPLTADIVSTWLKLGENRPTFVFAVDRVHAKELRDEFESKGVTTAYMDAFTTREERQQIGRQFNAGEIKVITNVGVLTTGIDWDVRCIVLARPTKSEILFVQMIGRGLRNAPGKDHLLILDHSATHSGEFGLGFVTDIHHDTLDDGTRSKPETLPQDDLPKRCSKCDAIRPKGVLECPECGFAPAPQTRAEVKDGDLVELKRGSKKKKMTVGELKGWYSGFLGYAKLKGYKDGWAYHNFIEKFGIEPPVKHVAPREPTEEIKGWVQHKAIKSKYKKKKKKAA